ncbi:hypothetical protein CH371_20130 [Leptospira wolffii]|uniref:TonB C-terminal domain-containing protein n=1 Tax=Leptospira wolffii TaxID=409998 RepID=A0A2M9Z6P6_9LEPT|nr:hypothetical protein CH371_20130 [Leptospira wolffii]
MFLGEIDYAEEDIDIRKESCKRLFDRKYPPGYTLDGEGIKISIDFPLSKYYPNSAKKKGIYNCIIYSHVVVTKNNHLAHYCLEENTCGYVPFEDAAGAILVKADYKACMLKGRPIACSQKVPLDFKLVDE